MASITPTRTIFGRRKPGSVDQLASGLRNAVNSGLLSKGEQLPTIRELSRETGLAYNAVNRAFAILQSEGLLISRKRAGTFVAGETEVRDTNHPAINVFALVGPELSTGFYPSLLRGFCTASDERGYQIITSNTDNDIRIQADTILQLMDKGVAGVALVPATLGPSPAHHIRQLQRNGIPVVLLHRGVEGVESPLVAIPAKKVGRLAGEELLKRGHTRVAFCASQRAGSTLKYEAGLRGVLAESGHAMLDDHIKYGNIVLFNNENYAEFERDVEVWFDRVMSGPDRPSAIFTSFETVGEVLYLVAMRRGMRVPEDISIVTIGAQDRRGAILRRLACVTINEQQAGLVTADMLDLMHRGLMLRDNNDVISIEYGFDAAESLAEKA